MDRDESNNIPLDYVFLYIMAINWSQSLSMNSVISPNASFKQNGESMLIYSFV